MQPGVSFSRNLMEAVTFCRYLGKCRMAQVDPRHPEFSSSLMVSVLYALLALFAMISPAQAGTTSCMMCS